jgi:hypothetical protein
MSKSKNEHIKKSKSVDSHNVNKENKKLHDEDILDSTKELKHKDSLILKYDFSQLHPSITLTTDNGQSLIVEHLMKQKDEQDHKVDGTIDSDIIPKKTRSKMPKAERPRSLPQSLSLWGSHSKNTMQKSKSADEIESKDSNPTMK